MKVTPSGLGMWIFRLNEADRGDYAQIVARCNRSCVSWLALCINATSMAAQSSGLLDYLRTHSDIRVYAWKYIYPNVDAEVSWLTDRIGRYDGLILDPEVEFEGHAAQADELGRRLRKIHGDKYIAYAPFDYKAYHPKYPFQQFDAFCDAAMPQCYWTLHNDQGMAANQDRIDHQWAGCPIPVLPIGVSYGLGSRYDNPPGRLTATDLDGFLQRYKGRQAMSLWSYDAADPLVWDLLEQYGRRRDNAAAVASGSIWDRLKGMDDGQ